MNQEQISVQLALGQVLTVVLGDLTQEPVDAIVNAANRFLSHDGGVAGAIVNAGGRSIQDESYAWVREHGPVAPGQAVLTRGGALPARYVIHAVGPEWTHGKTEPELLANAVQAALAIADGQSVTVISLPAISSGIFGFPKALAVEVIWNAVVSYLKANPTGIHEVRFCNIDMLTTGMFVRHALNFAKLHALETSAVLA